MSVFPSVTCGKQRGLLGLYWTECMRNDSWDSCSGRNGFQAPASGPQSAECPLGAQPEVLPHEASPCCLLPEIFSVIRRGAEEGPGGHRAAGERGSALEGQLEPLRAHHPGPVLVTLSTLLQ